MGLGVGVRKYSMGQGRPAHIGGLHSAQNPQGPEATASHQACSEFQCQPKETAASTGCSLSPAKDTSLTRSVP